MMKTGRVLWLSRARNRALDIIKVDLINFFRGSARGCKFYSLLKKENIYIYKKIFNFENSPRGTCICVRWKKKWETREEMVAFCSSGWDFFSGFPSIFPAAFAIAFPAATFTRQQAVLKVSLKRVEAARQVDGWWSVWVCGAGKGVVGVVHVKHIIASARRPLMSLQRLEKKEFLMCT